ncbi:hypothetical protein J3B01_002556 [Coemansia erecta]|nr:hypothetical protein J3B01_002556 [Coemansia erecta]
MSSPDLHEAPFAALDLSSDSEHSTPQSDNEALSRRERKAQFRLNKHRTDAYAAFLRSENLQSTAHLFGPRPRKTLCIINLGLGAAGCATSSRLEQVFSAFAGFERVVLKHNKPFSFARFRSGDEAKVAYDAVHEKPCDVFGGKLLFIEYLTHVQFARLADHEPQSSQVLDESRGLFYVPDFITKSEEQMIMQSIRDDEERELRMRGIQNDAQSDKWFKIQDRFVKHYGHSFDYHTKHVGDASLAASLELPAWIRPYIERIRSAVPSYACQPDQLTIQRYPPGSGIAFHADSHTAFTDTLVIVSLGTPVQMDFRKPGADCFTSVDLQPRSLVLMTGEARYGWEHAIRIRRSDLIDGTVRKRCERWSLTLRTISQSLECLCSYSALCDSNDAMVRDLRTRKHAKTQMTQGSV